MQGQKAKWKIKHEGEKERVQSISFFEKEEKEMLKNAKKKKKKNHVYTTDINFLTLARIIPGALSR